MWNKNKKVSVEILPADIPVLSGQAAAGGISLLQNLSK